MIILDYRDKRPIYEQVVEKLSHLIVCGAIETDSRMPSVRSLAMDLSVNPNTIQRAYTILEQEGYIYTVSGRGNYVSPPASWQSERLQGVTQELTELLESAKLAGMTEQTAIDLIHRIYQTKKGAPIND